MKKLRKILTNCLISNTFNVIIRLVFIVAMVCVTFELGKNAVDFIASKPQPTVVKIEVQGGYVDEWQDEYKSDWEGCGVFIADDLIMTAGHMVEDADEIWITWPNGKRHKAVSWYKETEADLGVVYIRTPEVELTAKFDNAKVGETVWALGSPFGVFPVLTKGIVSAIDMPDDFMFQKNMIITDCAINPGNSGCPLFNKDNNILGICSWGYNYSQGMSYFVRAEVCQLVIGKCYIMKTLEETE